jgi:hypothetical protein
MSVKASCGKEYNGPSSFVEQPGAHAGNWAALAALARLNREEEVLVFTQKYVATRNENVFLTKRTIVDIIWKEANPEGIAVTRALPSPIRIQMRYVRAERSPALPWLRQRPSTT